MPVPRFMTPLLKRASSRGLAAAAAIAALAVAGCGGSSSHTATKSATTSSASSSASSSAASSSAATSSAAGAPATFTSHPFATGVTIQISTPKGKVSITQPDDLTNIGNHIFVGFQNQVGHQGEPVPKGTTGTGNRYSTIVEFSSSGSPIKTWNVLGHIDGLAADPATGQVIATSNEDANPHLFVIDPSSPQAVSYHVPHLPHNGGLDAVSFQQGVMLISASAPGTSGGKAPPQASYPAVYVVHLNSSNHTVQVHGLYSDEATAMRANAGKSGKVRLALVDPDSNRAVPPYAQRFGGDFALTSQGDLLQVFSPGTSGKPLSALKLSQSLDDSVWSPGPSSTLYVTDNSADLIYKITGPFQKGEEVASVTPCDAGNAPTSCPAPPRFPPNYLGVVNQSTGAVSKFPLKASITPKGLLFVP